MIHRERVRVAWYPQWEGAIQAWAKSFIRKNSWRCERIHEYDDLLQDAYLTFLKIAKRYPRVMDPPHFMAIYKVALQNEMWDRARWQRQKAEVIDPTADALEYGAERIGEVTNNGYLSALIAEAPEEVKFALALLNDEKSRDKLWAEKPRARYQKPQPRENLNMRLNRMFGFKRARYDFTTAIRSLLTP